MYSADVRRDAIALMRRGISLSSISLSTGISRATLADWREHPVSAHLHAAHRMCGRLAGTPAGVRAGDQGRPAGQQGAYPAAPRLYRGDQLFPALAVPLPAAWAGSEALA